MSLATSCKVSTIECLFAVEISPSRKCQCLFKIFTLPYVSIARKQRKPSIAYVTSLDSFLLSVTNISACLQSYQCMRLHSNLHCACVTFRSSTSQ